VISARNADEWRAWLDEHHETESEVWLQMWKRSSGKQSIDWAQAVEVALRYGWIDGLVNGIDDQQYKQRFTPRRPKSKWSKVNKEIALRLIAAGEMTPMGLRAVEAAKASGEWDRAYSAQKPLRAPDDLREAIKANADAKRNKDRISTTRWNRWVEWLEGTEGRTRTRRRNLIVDALTTRDFGAIDKACPSRPPVERS
jgi:uncharacterized protein YdeI (YjbR/CyaY-like superfamily)